MENNYLCDWYRTDYEQYLRQAILFSSKINVLYPDISYRRPIDREIVNDKISILKKYEGFSNVNLVSMKGDSNRVVDFEHNPFLFDIVCKELNLTQIEKKCFLAYRDQEFDYLVFHDRAPWKDFCSYMHNVFNTAIAYTDMSKLFCEAYLKNQGNILSNSDFLYDLLSSGVIQKEKIKKFSELDHNEIFNIKRRRFSDRYCELCQAENKPDLDSRSLINAKDKVIEILIPDYSKLEIDDLYEIHLKANSEIEQLSTYLDEISLFVDNDENMDKLINRKINPAISELEAKVEGLHLTAVQKALSIKDIAAIPILVEVMPNLPTYVPLILSAVFIAMDVGIEIKKEYLQLKQDPLYFTIRLNKLVRKRKKR